jgi:hypothetical protein
VLLSCLPQHVSSWGPSTGDPFFCVFVADFQSKVQVAAHKNRKNREIFYPFSYNNLQDFSPIFVSKFSHQSLKPERSAGPVP